MRFIYLLLFLVSLGTSAQSSKNDDSYIEIKDIAYLSEDAIKIDSLQRLNLVIPKGIQNPPLLVWIGGGAWSFVSRQNEMDLARQIAARGIAVATIGHRLSKGRFQTNRRQSGVIHPAHIEDVAAAFNFLYKNSDQYGYDQKSIIVGGFSSGAHLAALLAMDPKYLDKFNLATDQIKAIIPVGGTYDINHYYNQFKNHPDPSTRKMAETHVMDVFGSDISLFAEASPASYLRGMNTPMLLISDNALRMYTTEFEIKLAASDYNRYQVHHVLEMNHQQLWQDLSFNPESSTLHLIVDYIKDL